MRPSKSGPTFDPNQSWMRKFLYMTLRGGVPRDHASGPTFDPNICLGPKLDQKISLPAAERRYTKEGG
eukprot:scaffold123704_cov47-Attheya_sp.AAC.1